MQLTGTGQVSSGILLPFFLKFAFIGILLLINVIDIILKVSVDQVSHN